MIRAIRLVALRVENVGTLRGPIELGPFAQGVNVISGSNEVGKSTLVEALKIGLFERHGTKNKGVMALQPHGTKLAPEVQIELDCDGERLHVVKRFIEKPMAEIRLANGSILKAQDADDFLRTKLEGRAPKKTGLSREDMGVWGLLWVTQDESAHADPGGTLDEEVRGALADAVSRQVGKVMGGKHGERIRARVQEELKKFYTPKTDKPTGDYKEALERKQAADKRVADIESAVREVEELAARLEAQRARLAEAERQLPRLKEEREDAHRQMNAIQQKQVRLREARAMVDATEARVTTLHGAVATRTAKEEEVKRLDGSVQCTRQNLAEFERLLVTREQEAQEAKEALRHAEERLREQRHALELLRQQLEREHARLEAHRVTEGLQHAEAIAREIEAGDRARASGGLDEAIYGQIEELSERVDTLRTKLSVEGTRIVARSEGQISIGTGKGMEVPALGRIELIPAQEGLGQAVVLAKEARSALKEALYNLGVDGVQRARELRAAREEVEREAEALSRRIKQLAPSGIDELAVRASRRAEERRRLEERLALALAAQEELDRVRADLAKHTVDAEAIQMLRAAEKKVALARESRGAMGTEVSVRAVSNITVRVGEDGPPVALALGETLPSQRITRPTVVFIGNAAEVLLTPRGEELARATVQLESAEHALSSALRRHAACSLEQAETMALARDEIARKKAAVEQRLAEAAPRGIDPLRAEVERTQGEVQEIETKLASTREALSRQAEVGVALDANPVNAQKFARLLDLEAALATQETAVSLKSARLRHLSGVFSGQEHIVSEQTPLEDPAGGPGWTVFPGESRDWVKLEQAERALHEAFEREQLTNLTEARERRAMARELVGKRERLVQDLKLVAPDGLEALRGRKRALEAAAMLAPDREQGPSLEELQRRIGELDAERIRAEEEQASWKNPTLRLEEHKNACAHDVGELRGRWMEQKNQYERCVEELAASRREAPDAVLLAELEQARAELDASKSHAERASTELAAATPELLRDEVGRAQFALDAHERSLLNLRDDVSSLQALLTRAAAEGRFEDLSEAKAEQAASAEVLSRVERQARAARILAELTEEAYTDAQRIFLGPVLKEAAPYLNNLRPGTELRMTQDLRLDKVVRLGMEEDFGQLSGGTREQLSVIVRIALARVFAKDRRPLPLILDDTMGWTDDARFVSMVRILRDAAKELQIILLTCHGTRFDRLQPEYRVDLDELRRNAAREMT